MKKITLSSLLLGAWLLLLIVPAFAVDRPRAPHVIKADKFMVSQPLSVMLKNAPPPAFRGWIIRKEHETPNHMTKIYDLPDPVIQDSSEAPTKLGVTL